MDEKEPDKPLIDIPQPGTFIGHELQEVQPLMVPPPIPPLDSPTPAAQ